MDDVWEVSGYTANPFNMSTRIDFEVVITKNATPEEITHIVRAAIPNCIINCVMRRGN